MSVILFHSLIACEVFKQTFVRALQFFILFFFPSFGEYLGSNMLGSSTDYFRKIFWISMDNRVMTKTKRGDLIDSLLQLKAENKPGDTFRECTIE